jgi:hypothetical protein
MCTNVQVYLRLAAVDFAVESVPTRAGAEQIPALEDGDDVVMANESGGIQAYLREHKVGCLLILTAACQKGIDETFLTVVPCGSAHFACWPNRLWKDISSTWSSMPSLSMPNMKG